MHRLNVNERSNFIGWKVFVIVFIGKVVRCVGVWWAVLLCSVCVVAVCVVVVCLLMNIACIK